MAETEDYQPSEYLTERGLQNKYYIAPRTAQRWRVTGGGPLWIRLGRRKVIYRIRDVEEWLAARTYRHRADELSGDRRPATLATDFAKPTQSHRRRGRRQHTVIGAE